MAIVSLAGWLTLGAFAAAAQTASATPKTQAWCQKTVPKISSILSGSSSNLAKRQAWVATRKQKIQERINKFKQQGLDVSKVTADFQTFSGQLDKWLTDYQTFITNLQATQQFSCGQAKGQFAAAVKTARSQRQVVKQDRDTFRDFYNQTLWADFQTLRQQAKAKK